MGLEELRVCDLFIPRTRELDVELLGELFGRRDVRAITKTPPLSFDDLDKIFWHFSSNGIYSVKSGYRLVGSANNHETSTRPPNHETTLWKLHLPPLVKVFLWRACRGCLPVLDVLRTRRLQLNPACPLCNWDSESVTHALLSCDKARDYLKLCSIGVIDLGVGTISDLLLDSTS